jgi:Holliday junction resolvase RusA-like endonuclease
VTFVFPVHRRRDVDNLYARAKGVVDGVKRGGWIVDDSSEWLDLKVVTEVRSGIRATVLLLEPWTV